MNLNSRKLIFAVILLIVSTIALFIGKADFTQWGAFMSVIYGFYFAGNVLSKKLNNGKTEN